MHKFPLKRPEQKRRQKRRVQQVQRGEKVLHYMCELQIYSSFTVFLGFLEFLDQLDLLGCI